MADLNLEAIESDLSFLARVVQTRDLGGLGARNRARLAAIADRYPMGGTHDVDDGHGGPDDAGTTSDVV